MTARLFLLAALAFTVTACQSTDPDTTSDGAMADAPMAGDMAAPTVTPEGTVSAVQSAGGLTSLSVAAATQNIDGWIARLSDDARFAPVVTDLRMLRGQLQQSPIDGEAVGETLQRLGTATSAAATPNTSLATLGQTLSDAGDSLTM